jgi:hypothetical protein
VKVGYAYVSLGETDKGIALIEKGIAKGGLKRPDDAKLRLGMAQLQSPKAKAGRGADAAQRDAAPMAQTADIARLWAHRGAGTLRTLMHWLQDLGGGVHAIDTGFHRDLVRRRLPDRARTAARPSSTPAPTSRCRACWARWMPWAWRATRSTWVIPTHVHLDHAGGVGA